MKPIRSKSLPARFPLSVACALLFLGGVFSAGARAETPAAPPLITNGDFELSTIEPNWPDHWGQPRAGSFSWEAEEGRRYIRLNATAPGETVMLFRSIPIPAGAKALKLTLRGRVIGLKCGAQPWFDARVIADFKNPAGQKLKGAKPITFRKDTDGWVERSVSFAVPEGAAVIELMPCVFQAYSGTFDLDELQLTAIDLATLNPPPAP